MFRFGDNNVQTSKQRSFKNSQNEVGIVIDVILDEENKSLPVFKEVGTVDGIESSNIHTGKIGGVRVRTLSNSEVQDDELPIIYALDDTIKTLPILGEEVQIVRVGGKKFYTRISTSGNPNISNDGLESYKEIFGNADSSANSTSYGNNQSTGIAQPQGGGVSNKGQYGDYFEETLRYIN